MDPRRREVQFELLAGLLTPYSRSDSEAVGDLLENGLKLGDLAALVSSVSLL